MPVQQACRGRGSRRRRGDSSVRVRSASAISRTGRAGNLSCPILDPAATLAAYVKPMAVGRRFASAPLLSRHPSSARPIAASLRRTPQPPILRPLFPGVDDDAGAEGERRVSSHCHGRRREGDRLIARGWDMAVGRRCLDAGGSRFGPNNNRSGYGRSASSSDLTCTNRGT